MASQADICNWALSALGQTDYISDITEDSVAARVFNQHWAHERDLLLKRYPWPFATVIQTLGLIANDPNDEWAYEYALPSNCLRALDIVTGDRTAPWQVPFTIAYGSSTHSVYTDQPDAQLRYIRQVTDVGRYDDWFAEALSFRLAIRAAAPLSISPGIVAQVRVLSEDALGKAMAFHENQLSKDPMPEAEHIRARGSDIRYVQNGGQFTAYGSGFGVV